MTLVLLFLLTQLDLAAMAELKCQVRKRHNTTSTTTDDATTHINIYLYSQTYFERACSIFKNTRISEEPRSESVALVRNSERQQLFVWLCEFSVVAAWLFVEIV